MALILVGAMLVGSIRTVWRPENIRSKQVKVETFPPAGENAVYLARGAELGHFRMGSTVLVLFAKDKIEWHPALQSASLTQMGQWLGHVVYE